MRSLYAVTCFSLLLSICRGLDNGLALTPPMGWLSWSVFWCHIDCQKEPDTCVSEKNIAAMADVMDKEGYKDVGYNFVAIDDCWFAPERDEKGQLQCDPQRFSKGIKWLSDYVHNKGMLFGIYEDYGEKTCAGYPGTLNHEDIDAATFASWAVDYVKLDGCYVNASDLNRGYPAFRDSLNKTGRKIVYSCEWPLYTQQYEGKQPNYTAVKETCNLWRNWNDIALSWDSLISIIDYFTENQEDLAAAQGPGGWNDPDMLIIGNSGALTVDQAKLQMAIWSMWSAPLIMSVDLRTIEQPFKQILQNKAVIAVDQDPLGIMGKMHHKVANVSVYVKPMTPIDEQTGHYSYALAFMNRGKKCGSATVTLQDLGLTHPNGYIIEDLFEYEPVRVLGPKDQLSTNVNPTGVTMYKATVLNGASSSSRGQVHSVLAIFMTALAIGKAIL